MGEARPPVLRPMLTGGAHPPTSGAGWVVEPKWDGVRLIVTIADTRVRLTSRNGNDVTAAYPELATTPIDSREAVLDGEVVAFDGDGRADFGRLQRRMHVRRPAAQLVEEVPVDLVVFDVLWLDGADLTAEPWTARRAVLDDLSIAQAHWVTSPVLDLDASSRDLVQTGHDLGLEGFMLKRAGAPYLPGKRSDAWVKVKSVRRREFVVGGWSPGRGGREGALGSLALGVYHEGGLRFVGMAGSGLTGADLEAFSKLATSLERDESPFATPVPHGVKWLEPVLVAEVMFSEVTAAGTLRHPVLQGFRTDIEPREVVFDAELSPRQ